MTTLLSRIKIVAACLFLAGGSLALNACGKSADAPNEAQTGAFDKASLVAAVDTFSKAFDEEDYGKMIDLGMPEVLMMEIMGQFGETATFAEARDQMVDLFEETFQTVTMEGYSMDMDRVAVKTSPTGRAYALIPTSTDMTVGEMKMRAKVDTLALVHEGQWYMLNPADAQTIAIIKRVFPDLKDVTLEPTEMEFLD